MGWIAGWNKRIKLTISGSCIEGDLSNFPIMVHLDSTCSGVFNELGSNSKRILVVNSEQSQCYVEVERWDETTKNAWLWVNVPTLTSGISSDLYLYYDNLRPDNSAYVGTVGETSAQNVWDSNFVGVWHMNQDPTGGSDCIKDSTVSDNHGTPGGSMASEDLVDGRIGKALDFDGDNDLVNCGNDSTLHFTDEFTVSVIIKTETAPVSDWDGIVDKGDYNCWALTTRSHLGNTLRGVTKFAGGESGLYTSASLNIGTYYNVCMTAKKSGICYLYQDGVEVDTEAAKSGDIQNPTTYDLKIADSTTTNNFDGDIEEVRISNIARSAPWIKATYYSNWNQLINYGNEETISSGFLPGWNNRLKLTIQNDYIDNTLTDFPVMIKLSNSSGFNSYDNRDVFYELEANINRKKIAITDSTGTLQCFVEIERFSCAETEAVLWTKLPVIYADVGTCFYLYYDKTQADNISFVGDVNSIQAQNVWDSNFVGVWHMNQNPTGGSGCIKDSTSNVNHGTPGGSMASDDLVDGKVGKTLDFDGSDDYINCGSAASLDDLITKTVEATINLTTYGESNGGRIAQKANINADGWNFSVEGGSNNRLFFGQDWNNGTLTYWTSPIDSFVTGSWYSVAVTYDKWLTTNDPLMCINGSFVTTGENTPPTGACDSDAANDLWVGARKNAGSDREFNGKIDEVRISSIIRSAPWIKATYYSNWDDLIIYEMEDISANWLDDWAKRIKLTVDQTKIDSSLTDFPVLITLTSGVQSDFFSELDYGSSVDDAFTGTNGSVPNSDLWYKNHTLVDSKVEISSNKARLTYVSDESNSSVKETSNYLLVGDFDIQVDIELLTDITASYWAVGLHFNAVDGSGYWGAISRGYVTGPAKHFRFRYNGNDGNSLVDESSSLTSSKLRLVRGGANISAYYWDGSWNQIGVSNAWGSADIQISLYGYKNFTGSEIQLDFDNFTINSGSIIWPQDTYPNRKKIAATINDGVTQCSIEIEQFDTTSGTVNLWTKIPLISYSSDTDIYLYYDCNKEDNTTYVGDVGSTPAQNVWDENFVGVWHMNQDPSVGGACIKDSTVSGSHGTPEASMTSSDLVDGKTGKALDFDGSDDYIDCGTSDDLDFVSNFTLECVIKLTSVGTYKTLLSKGDRAGTNINYGLLIQSDHFKFESWDGANWHNVDNLGIDYTADVFQCVGLSYDGSHLIIYKDATSNPTVFSNVLIGDNYPLYFGARKNTTPDHLSTGQIDEVRISDIARSASWIKATYYSNWNTLLAYGSAQSYTPPPDYYYHGYVKEKGVYVSRKVYLYRRDTGLLIDSCMSNDSTGYYLLETSVSGEHFIVALDDDAGDDYNALIQDRLYPNDM